MNGLKISKMQVIDNPTDDAKIPIVQNGTNYSMLFGTLSKLFIRIYENSDIPDILKQLQTQINSKANVSDIPTKVSQLVNDSNFLTSLTAFDNIYTKQEVYSKGETYSKEEIANLLEALNISTATDTDIRSLYNQIYL